MPDEQAKAEASIVLAPQDLAKLEEGKDPKEWLASQHSREVWVSHHGKRWRFLVRDPGWLTLTMLGDKCKETDAKGEVSINEFKYFRELIKATVVESPFGSITDVTLAQLSPDAGKVLQELVAGLNLGAETPKG